MLADPGPSVFRKKVRGTTTSEDSESIEGSRHIFGFDSVYLKCKYDTMQISGPVRQSTALRVLAGIEDCPGKGRFLEDVGRQGSLCYKYDSLVSLLSMMQGFGPANTPYRLLPGMVAPASATDESIRAQVHCYGSLQVRV